MERADATSSSVAVGITSWFLRTEDIKSSSSILILTTFFSLELSIFDPTVVNADEAVEAEWDGAIANEDGIDPAEIEEWKLKHRTIVGFPGAQVCTVVHTLTMVSG